VVGEEDWGLGSHWVEEWRRDGRVGWLWLVVGKGDCGEDGDGGREKVRLVSDDPLFALIVGMVCLGVSRP